MKFIVSLLAISVSSVVVGMFAPWWSVAFAAAGVGILMNQSSLRNFFAGFLGVALAWLGLTVWIDHENGGILSTRMAQVLPVGGQVIYLHLITALLGGIIGGLSALSASYIRALFVKADR